MALIICKLCSARLDEHNFLAHIKENHEDLFLKFVELDLKARAIAHEEMELTRASMELVRE